KTKTPPGPGIAPTRGETMISRKPRIIRLCRIRTDFLRRVAMRMMWECADELQRSLWFRSTPAPQLFKMNGFSAEMDGKRQVGREMVAQVATVAFLGLEARAVEVQVQIAAGLPKFLVV